MLPRTSSYPTLLANNGRSATAATTIGATPQRMRHILSAPGSLVDLVLHEVQRELTLEAMTKAPAISAGACMLSVSRFPDDLLEPDAERDADTVASVGSCLALPPDGECTRNVAQYRLVGEALVELGEAECDARRRSEAMKKTERWMRVRQQQRQRRQSFSGNR